MSESRARKITVVGAGYVGQTCAQKCAEKELAEEICLIDVLEGGGGNDYLFGGDGRDSLSGGKDDDYLSGDEDSDSLAGGDGDDVLAPDPGRDGETEERLVFEVVDLEQEPHYFGLGQGLASRLAVGLARVPWGRQARRRGGFRHRRK